MQTNQFTLRGRLGMVVLAGWVTSSAGFAHAAPPSEAPTGGGRESGGAGVQSGGVSIGGFVPPSEAEFDPNTTADPGLLDRQNTRQPDQTYGPTGAGDRMGYDIVDPGVYSVEGDWNAEIPDYHVVQDGDTLSGICEFYYGDLYLWPKVWAYNPHITNPHWIFPGDRVRLTDPEGAAGGPDGPGLAYSETYDPRQPAEETYLLERYAFIDEEELAKSMEVIGGADAKVMMATLDTAYISYDDKNPPIPGERLSVYRPKQPVYDIKVKGKKGQRQKKGKRIGWLVEVVGEVYVQSVAPKSAEANIVDSVQPVERGLRVGELKTRFSRVSSTANQVTANGVVVETIRDATITGETQFVIVNLGSDDGIRRGNTMEVVEKGDAYTSDHRMHQPYEKGHPRRVLGNLLVLQVEEDSSLAVVTFSLQELVIGNHVEITEAGEEPEDHEPYKPSKRKSSGEAEGEGDAKAEDGEVEAEGSLRIGT
jgi:hypothetical protein